MRRVAPWFLVLLLAACGGSDDETPAAAAPPPPPAPAPLAPQGAIDLTAAISQFLVDPSSAGGDSAGDGGVGGGAGDGSPIPNATVFLVDANGKTVSGRTDAQGGYFLRFKTAEFQPPYVVKVVDAGGNILSSVNEIQVASGKAVRANINQLTDKVVSDSLAASAGGTDKNFNGAAVDTSKLAKAKSDILASVNTALATAGVADTREFDPIRSVYKYDGTGVDAVIESISHVREPSTGVTQLVAKLAPVQTNNVGSVVPTLINPTTPLVPTQVAVASSPALTYTKISAWINYVNKCLALSPVQPATGDCSEDHDSRILSLNYLHNGKDFERDFNLLLSDPDEVGINSSEFRNPNILFTANTAQGEVTVVEVTIRQPRIGPLAGTLNTPVEYTKTLVFRRDDTTPNLIAGNWVLAGNQRTYDWDVSPRYFSTLQQTASRNVNAAGGDPSFMKSSIQLTFQSQVFNQTTKTYQPANVRAVRFKGPGLPAAGVVLAPFANNPNVFSIFSKDGTLPAAGQLAQNVQSDFRIQGVILPTKEAFTQAAWPTNAAHSDTPTTDISGITAFSAYSAEIFRNDGTSITETTRILAPLQSAVSMASIPLHDLSPSIPLLSPTLPASNTVNVAWNRTPGATRIDSGFLTLNLGQAGQVSRSATVSDSLTLNPTSTSVAVGNAGQPIPAGSIAEAGITGRGARSLFVHSIRR